MAIILEEIYEVALHRYNMKLVAGGRGLRNLVDWVHTVEEMDYVSFLKGRELIITTGIREKDEETLVRFVKSLHETGASGLVINIGKYITRVPRGVIAYSEEAGFPVFTLPWEVHLVDFNRDLCNLIYKTMQEQDGLETALQKAIFSHKEEQQYMPVLHENHIHKDTEFFMIQCYFPANKDIQADDKFDNTQFFYRFLYAVCAALMIFARHNGLASNRHDSIIYALVVGSNISVVESFCHHVINSFYNIFTSKHGQWLAGKTC